MADVASATQVVMKTTLEGIAAIIAASASLLWPVVVAATVWTLRREFGELLKRMRKGKAGPAEFEFSDAPIVTATTPLGESVDGVKVLDSETSKSGGKTAADETLSDFRTRTYEESRFAFVQFIARPTDEPGQTHEIEIFTVRRRPKVEKMDRKSNILKVRYFLGKSWNNRTFESSDRRKRFAIRVFAYGGFLCVAEADWDDNVTTRHYIYIALDAATNQTSRLENGM